MEDIYFFGRGVQFVGILDIYPNAAVGYSLRKLRASYTGACIRVRRSSDNVEQDIGFTNNVLNTAALLSFVGANNGFVVIWYDQSGNVGNAIQTIAANQPRIVNSGVLDVVNGLPAILGDGVNDTLRQLSPNVLQILNNPFTVFTVVDKIGTSGIFGLFDGNSLAGGFNLRTNGYDVYQNGAQLSDLLSNNNQVLISFKSSTIGTDWDLWNNNNQVVNTGRNIGTLTPSSLARTVSLFDRTNNQSRCNMYMQEFIVYNSNQLTTNRVGIQTNINNHYAIYT